MLYTVFMIGYIEGKIVYYGSGYIIVNANGIGYKTFVTKETIESLKSRKAEMTSLWTYLAVKENSLDLYGFSDQENLDFFELLLSVSGIGPKSALAILNIAPVNTLRMAVSSGDPAHLTKTTGIGTKKAEKIILELRDKLDYIEGDSTVHKSFEEVIDALEALGYSRREAQDAVKKLPSDITETEDKIKAVLKRLGK